MTLKELMMYLPSTNQMEQTENDLSTHVYLKINGDLFTMDRIDIDTVAMEISFESCEYADAGE